MNMGKLMRLNRLERMRGIREDREIREDSEMRNKWGNGEKIFARKDWIYCNFCIYLPDDTLRVEA